MSKTIRIGGASGYWGDSDMALPQFLKEGNVDYIVFDYLAEITMSIMARQRAEEKAQQVPVKITVPLIFCILPTLFIAVMGPAVLSIMDSFSK